MFDGDCARARPSSHAIYPKFGTGSTRAHFTSCLSPLWQGPGSFCFTTIIFSHFVFFPLKGRFDTSSGCFGWRGMTMFSLPLTFAVVWWTSAGQDLSPFYFVMLTVATGQMFNRWAKKCLNVISTIYSNNILVCYLGGPEIAFV